MYFRVLLHIILVCIGGFLFLKEMIDTYIDLDLFIDRWRVPESMRALQKRCDLSLAFGHLSAALFGLSLIIVGVVRLQGADSAPVGPLLFAIGLLLAVNCIEKLIFSHRAGIRDKIEEIRKKWKSQKRFTPGEHDHEVNLYRGLTASLNGTGNAVLLFVGELLLYLIIR